MLVMLNDAAVLSSVGDGRSRGFTRRLLLASFLLAGCSIHRPASRLTTLTAQTPAAAKPSRFTPTAVAPSTSPSPRSSREHRVGTVRVLGAGTRFVLIESPSAGADSLPDGQMLRCVSSTAAGAATTALLRVVHERRPPFVVADVVDGEPHVGDTAYLAATPPPAPAAPTVLPTATSGVLPITLPGDAPPTKTRP